MTISQLVYNERNKKSVTKFNADINCVFTIKPFAGLYMAFVEVRYCLNKNREQTLNGNSLWNLGAMPLENLKEKIKSYNSIQDVIKDFEA